MNRALKVVTLSPICQNSLSHVVSISNLNSSNFSVKFLEYLNSHFFQVIIWMSFIIANQRNEQNLSISPWIETAQSSFRKSCVSLYAFRVSQITKYTCKNKDKEKKKNGSFCHVSPTPAVLPHHMALRFYPLSPDTIIIILPPWFTFVSINPLK